MLKSEVRGDTLVLRLDKPSKLNAWDQGMREDLRRALADAEAAAGIVAVVVTGAGTRAFCAGADLGENGVAVSAQAASRMQAFRDLYVGILSFGKPLVAALNGLAAGSALQAILLMDARVGHAGVRLGMPEVNSGIPCITGSTILSWTVGATRARELSVSGRLVDGEECRRIGLIDELVAPEQVLEHACGLAGRLGRQPAVAYAQTKRWLRDLLLPQLDAAFERAAAIRLDDAVSDTMRAGVAGFLQRA